MDDLVFPEGPLRRAGMHRLRIYEVMRAWNTWGQSTRNGFLRMVDGTPREGVLGAVARFVANPPHGDQGPAPAGAEDTRGAPQEAPEDDVPVFDPGARAEDPEPRIADALRTVAGARAHLREHPEDREAMLSAELGGARRRTLLALLQE